jgi:hypothetical protein
MHMKKLPFSFMALGVLYVLIGMAYGIDMSVKQEFATAPAHGHLNLLGFVLGSIFAFYYHLVPSAQSRAGWVHFGLHQLAVILMFPGVIMATSGGGDGLAKIASILAIIATLAFAWVLFKNRATS